METRNCILIVDADATRRDAAARLLRGAGYAIVTAQAGEAGLQTASAEQADLILLSLELPDGNGLEFCCQIGAQPDLTNSRVILMSDDVTNSVRARALKAGAVDCFEWNLEPAELIDRVKAALALRRSVVSPEDPSPDLTERVRHLECLHGISLLCERPGVSVEEMLQGTIQLMIPAWHFPAVTCARVVLGDDEYQSSNFTETPWKLACDLVVLGEAAGRAEVYYLDERLKADAGPFRAGELKLLRAIAERLGKAIERKEAEAALSAAEERYRIVSELVSDLAYSFRVRADGKLESEWATEAIYSLTGYGPKELDAQAGWLATIHADDWPTADRHIKQLLAGTKHVHELRIVTKDGDVRWLRVHGQPVWGEEGRVVRIYGAAQDVTEHRLDQQALRDSEHRFRKLFEQTLIGIIASGPQGELTAVNPAMVENLGYDSEEELLGQPAEEIWYDPADRVRALQVANDFGYLPIQEVRFRRKDGSVAHFLVTASLDQDKEGKYQGLTATYTDIGDLKEAEEKLQWELRVDTALYALYRPLISPDSSIQHIANMVLEQARGLTGSAHGYVSAIDPVTGDNVAYTLTEMLKGECLVRGEARRTVFPVGRDGRYGGLWGHALNTKEAFRTSSPDSHPAAKGTPEAHIPLEQFLSVPVLLGDELVGQIALANPVRDYGERDLVAIQRMSEFYALAIQRRRAEQALQESEEKYRDLVENINDVIYNLDADGVVTYISPAIKSLLGYDVSEALGKHYGYLWDLGSESPPPGGFPRLDPDSTLRPRKVRGLTKSGDERWIRTSGQARIVDGQVAGLRGVLTDVTEQVRADLQLQAALAEKEILLKEIHHRVKNNLQLVSALLSLQARATDDERVTTAFEESQHRILSMAGIHEHLYRAQDLSRVDMGAYIRELADEMGQSYGTPTVSIKSEADEIMLDIDRAIPCGLIVNELVSNAIKHAFPLDGRQAGEVGISMRRLSGKDDRIELIVHDNGVGLPADVELEDAKTLGLTMIGLLCRQLGGELEVHRNNGTSVRILFRV